MDRIVIELNAGTDFHVGICGAQFVDFVEVDPFVVTIVIGERDIGEAAFAGAVDPGLEERLTVRLDAVALRVAVVVGEQFHHVKQTDAAARRPYLRRGQKFLPDAQLGVLGEKNFGDENLVRRKIAGGDGCRIIDVLERVDQDRPRFVLESVIIGPNGEDGFG